MDMLNLDVFTRPQLNAARIMIKNAKENNVDIDQLLVLVDSAYELSTKSLIKKECKYCKTPLSYCAAEKILHCKKCHWSPDLS